MNEKTLKVATHFDGKLLKLDVLEVEMESGRRAEREIVRHPGVAAVLGELADGRLVLVRQFRKPIEGYATLEAFSKVEETRRHRFSALVDGICIGVGTVFILLGVLMPITSAGMLVQGLMSIIGGLAVMAIGAVVEVYHWAKLN